MDVNVLEGGYISFKQWVFKLELAMRFSRS
jgi:hypothetical protein